MLSAEQRNELKAHGHTTEHPMGTPKMRTARKEALSNKYSLEVKKVYFSEIWIIKERK
jgi:hypothetical protein